MIRKFDKRLRFRIIRSLDRVYLRGIQTGWHLARAGFSLRTAMEGAREFVRMKKGSRR